MTDTNDGARQRRHNDLVLSYLSLRSAVGTLGVFLPAALLAWGLLSAEFPPTISEFYYTRMSDVLVGTLSAIAVFLWSYRGYAEPGRIVTDARTARLAALGALGVAFFPCQTESSNLPLPAPSLAQSLLGAGTTSALHYAAAALFFAMLAVFCLVLFVRGASAPPGPGAPLKEQLRVQTARAEARLHRLCGATILIAVALIGLGKLTGWANAHEAARPVFWLETLACLAFALSWLVKGQSLAPMIGGGGGEAPAAD